MNAPDRIYRIGLRYEPVCNCVRCDHLKYFTSIYIQKFCYLILDILRIEGLLNIGIGPYA